MVETTSQGGDHPAVAGIPLVFGGNVFGWTIDRDQSFRVLDAFYEAGGRMIDSAEGYSSWVPGNQGGESEAIIGAWLEARGVRGEMRIATKTGMGGPPHSYHPEKVATALAGSLDRLRTDCVDLYYAHRDDHSTPLDELVAAFDAPFRAGQVREIGASNYSAERLQALLDTARRLGMQPVTAMQPEYNLVMRGGYEGALQGLCVARGIAVMPFYGLASGFLSGKYRRAEDFADHARAHALAAAADAGGWDVLAAMDAIVRETGAAHAQVAVAWLNAQPGIAAPLMSATSVEQLAQLVEAVSLTLSAEQIATLDRAAAGECPLSRLR